LQDLKNSGFLTGREAFLLREILGREVLDPASDESDYVRFKIIHKVMKLIKEMRDNGMYCDECKTKPATVSVTQMFNGNQVQLHLCPECAAQKGVGFFDLGGTSLPKLLGSFFGLGPLSMGQVQPSLVTSKSCPAAVLA
jgi:hypothetical protein